MPVYRDSHGRFASQGFKADLDAFIQKANAKQRAVFINVASATWSSIVNGSPITGSPGQLVGQYGPGYHPGKVGGTLKAGWLLEFISNTEARIVTSVIYAPPAEYNLRGARQRSSVGGYHSMALTIAGFDRILEEENKKLAGQ